MYILQRHSGVCWRIFQPPPPTLQNGSRFVGLFCSYGNANSHEIFILQVSLLTERREVFVLTSEFCLCLYVSWLWPHAYSGVYKRILFPSLFKSCSNFVGLFCSHRTLREVCLLFTELLVFIRLYQSKEVNVLYHFPCPKHFSWNLFYLYKQGYAQASKLITTSEEEIMTFHQRSSVLIQ